MSDMGTDNKKVIWAWAAAAGVLAFLILKFLMSYGFWAAVFLAVLIAVLVAILIWIGFYRDAGEVAAPAPAEPAKVAEAPAPAPEPEAAPEPEVAPEPEAAPEPAPASEQEPAAASDDSDGPEVLSGPQGDADDLKKIKGVGPGLEKTLNELGFYHYRQIAAWTPAHIEWVDQRLKFKGRITRDNWVDQAAELAKGK